jgi:hypothetical protein
MAVELGWSLFGLPEQSGPQGLEGPVTMQPYRLLRFLQRFGDGNGVRVLRVDEKALSQHLDDPDLFWWQGVNRCIQPGPVIVLL